MHAWPCKQSAALQPAYLCAPSGQAVLLQQFGARQEGDCTRHAGVEEPQTIKTAGGLVGTHT